ncbi:MAG TPA: BatA domain-containing protein, partial [Marivita sp.]|nr:BatA domain-containing protein [Marivita sp.]
MTLFGIGFATPWLLLALLALPILWLILRAVPPAPIRRMFPGVVLLLGMKDDDQVSDRTPWWLLLLRMLAVAALIVGLAGPILNPDTEDTARSDAPVLVLMDGSWASAASWRARTQALDGLLVQAARDDRRVALIKLSAPEPASFQAADDLRARLVGLTPEPWEPGTTEVTRTLELLPEGAFDTYWLSDGLDRDSRDALLGEVQDRGVVTVFQAGQTILGLTPARFEDGNIALTAVRAQTGSEREVTILAQGRDPAGNPAVLARATATFASGDSTAQTALALPSELRARINRFEIEGNRSAGATTLPDDSLRRREVALIAGREDREGLQLLSPLHYLEKALEPSADLLSGALMDVIPANPDVIALADVATLGGAEQDALTDWLDNGGILLRFAGPRLAASDVSREEEDPLMPVRLRAGGRSVGGAMSWGEPKALAAFPEESPFFGLNIPSDVTVSAQVMAQPDPALADR